MGLVRVLRVPDEKYRDKVFTSMRENLTTLNRELGRLPEWNEMARPLVSRLEEVLGKLEPAPLPQTVYERARKLKASYCSDEWLHKKGRQRPGREVKIAGGVNVVQRLHKAPGGLLRATLEFKGERLASVTLSGDFFSYLSDAVQRLESELTGASLERLPEIVTSYYASGTLETPGVTALDWLEVLQE